MLSENTGMERSNQKWTNRLHLRHRRNRQKKKKGKKRTRRIILVIVLLLLLLLGGIFAYRHFVGVQPNDTVLLEENIKAKLGQLEDKSNEEIEAALNEVVEEGTVCISINMNPVFSSGKAEGTLKIENGPMNLYNQRVVITLAETGEEIYHSGLMPVDSHIQTDKLDVELEAGEYDAIATFHAYDVETDAEIGAAIAQIRISVLS